MKNDRSYPFDRITGREIRDLAQPGYYPGFSTLGQQEAWDDATRETVLQRLASPPPIRFFDAGEAAILSAVLARILPQDDRAPEKTIAILPAIDERLWKNALRGFRYENMPSDRDAYHLGLKAIGEMAHNRFGAAFPDLPVHRQELLLKSLHEASPDPDHPVWHSMPVHRFWSLLLEDCVTAYYSHPWSWDEIGFGGPAYPRGYMRLENGLPEPWETEEQRYEWNAPVDSVSELDEKLSPPPYLSTHGHGGSH